MKYKLIGDNDIDNPIETVLKNRGVDKSLFNVGAEVVLDYELLDNVQEAIELLLSHLDDKICIVVDCDVDGFTSASTIYNYLKEEYPNLNLTYKLHKGKEHGLSKDIKIEDDVKLVIIPDASSNDYEQHKELRDRGIDILILDHHEADKYSEYAVTVNNQLSEKYSNKNLSGVGIVYKFLVALDDYNFTDKADYYLDLIALGNIADVMNMKSEETRYLCKKGLKNINNKFLQSLIDDNSYELEGKMNFNIIGWTIAPKLNGTIRSGNSTEKDKMFRAFLSDDYDFCLDVAKMCKNIKAKQDRAVKTAMTKLEKEVKFMNIEKCLLIDSGKVDPNFRGLVAGKLADKYGVPTLLYSDKGDGEVGGSFRGAFANNIREDLLGCNGVTMAQGHSNVGGFAVKKESVNSLRQYLNELYKEQEVFIGKQYEVDFEVESYEIYNKIVDELAELEDEFGNGLDFPLLLIRDVHVTNPKINRTNIVFEFNDIKFLKKYPTNAMKEQFSEDVFLDVIVKCTWDNYNNKGQCEIVDFKIN